MSAAVRALQSLWLRSWFWLVPMLAAVIIEGRGIASVGLWNDEFFTARAVVGGLGEANGEAPYLPYYTVVWIATGGGSCTSETCLRLPSVVAMVLAVAVIALTAKRVAGPRAGLAAGLLMAIAPATQRYAQDARPFALGTLLASLATLFLVVAATSPHRRSWVPYGIAVALTGIVLPPALALLPGHAVLMWRRPFPRREYVRWAVALLACLPVFLAALFLLSRASSWRGFSDTFVVHYTNIWVAWTNITTGGASLSMSAGAFAMAIFLLGISTRIGIQWTLGATVAAAGIWVASFGPYSWFMGRFFVPFIGMALVAAAAALASFSVKKMSAILVVIGVVTLPIYTDNRSPWSRGYDFRTSIGIINSNWQVGDRIEWGQDGQFGTAWPYYATDLGRIGEVGAPGGRVWVINDYYDCTPSQVWDLGIGNTLSLCDSTGNEVEHG